MIQQPTVLIVDDDLDVLFFVDDLLRELGFRSVKATSTSDAIETLATTQVDAVILDFDLIPRAPLQVIEGFSREQHETPLLVMADVATRPEGDSSPSRCFVEHPPEIVELARALRDCMGSVAAR